MPEKPGASRARYTRRSVLLGGTLGALTLAAEFSPLALAEEANNISYSPVAVDLEIATLGAWLLEAEPESAARIEAAAREIVGLASTDQIDWPVARRARILLKEPKRTIEESAVDNYVFVDGWPLTPSEAGTALFFAAAQSGAQD